MADTKSKSEVLKVKVAFGGEIHDCDGIEWQGKLWLVPFWLDSTTGQGTTPGRVIRFDNLPHSDVRGTSLGDYVVTDSMPKELFDVVPLTAPVPGYEHVELPAMKRPDGQKPH